MPKPVHLTREQQIIQKQTQALKDIINTANSGESYSPEELLKSFQKDYTLGYFYLTEKKIPEIA